VPRIERRSAIRFIVFLGFVSLLADVTYEGARSIIGPYFVTLGASAGVLGLVVGSGELAGYGLRLLSGYLAERTHAYWPLTIIGYVVNLFAMPLLGFAQSWGIAAALVIGERTGKSIRTPARDVMLSHATQSVGRGWGFGLHGAMDQVGAVAGPLLVAWMLARTGAFPIAFKVLAIPAALAVITLLAARFVYPHPERLESHPASIQAKGYPRGFWLYVAAAGMMAAGYVDFALLAYHFEKAAIVPTAQIPLFYAGAMAANAFSALLFGWLYDRIGILVMPIAIAFSAASLPLGFLGGEALAMAAVGCWGVGLGGVDALRAEIATMIPPDRRGSAYGIFYAGFGVMWFAGSAIMGRLYDVSASYLVFFGLAAQAVSVILFQTFRATRR
jgi:MFS family permease